MSTEVFRPSASALPQVRVAATIWQWAALIGAALYTLVPSVWWPLNDRLSAGVARVEPLTRELLQLHALRHSLEGPAVALLAAGLVAIYVHYRGQLGALGQAGLAMIIFGLSVRALLAFAIVITDGVLGTHVDELDIVHLTPVIAGLGSLPFGIAVLRSGAFTRVAGLLVVLPALLLFAELAAVGISEGIWWLVTEALMALNGLGFVLISYAYWRQR